MYILLFQEVRHQDGTRCSASWHTGAYTKSTKSRFTSPFVANRGAEKSDRKDLACGHSTGLAICTDTKGSSEPRCDRRSDSEIEVASTRANQKSNPFMASSFAAKSGAPTVMLLGDMSQRKIALSWQGPVLSRLRYSTNFRQVSMFFPDSYTHTKARTYLCANKPKRERTKGKKVQTQEGLVDCCPMMCAVHHPRSCGYS